VSADTGKQRTDCIAIANNNSINTSNLTRLSSDT
jgi:hypothetical protein